jgi:pimeloyl-ACP methyl ester carboxylesterase
MQVRDSDAQFRAHEAAGAYVSVNGERIFYRTEGDRGDGSPVVMLHGVPTCSYLYRKLISLTVGHHFVLAPDFPGLGLSAKPPARDYSWHALAQFVADFVKALKLKPVHLVMHDIGGPIGLEFAIRNPDQVSSITLLDAPTQVGTFKKPFIMQLLATSGINSLAFAMLQPRLMLAAWQSMGTTGKYSVSLTDMQVYRRMLTHNNGQRSFLKIMQSFETNAEKERFFDEGLRSLNKPALAIWGKHDPAISVSHGEWFAARVSGTQLHLLEAKHFLMEDHAEEMASLMTPFWDQVDGVQAESKIARDRLGERPQMKGWHKQSSEE